MELNDLDFTFGYTIDNGPSPVSPDDVQNYVGRVRLLPVTDSDATLVEWSSSWEAHENTAQEFCKNIYMALLGDLKASFS